MQSRTGTGSHAPSMRPRRRSGSTGDCINDERICGYVVAPKGKIIGEARNFDPYSRFGDIMLYEIDSLVLWPDTYQRTGK
ncbi:MAG: hypothetical protein ACREBI_02910 [Nitrosotalea sp.]